MQSFLPRPPSGIRETARLALLACLLLATRAVCEAAPANDNLANAQVLTPISWSLTGDNTGATTEAFEEVSGYPAAVIDNSVWYTLTPTVSGTLSTSAERNDQDPLNTCLFKGPGTPSRATYVTQDQNANGIINGVHVDAGQQYYISLSDGAQGSAQAYQFSGRITPDSTSFFAGQAALSNGVYYLEFADNDSFGYYSFLDETDYIYHFDLGYEYVFDANDGKAGVYFYDFESQGFFYTSPTFGFPYLYDFTLAAVLYYYPDTKSAGHYTTNPRYFYNFATNKIITK